jgi:protease IV
MQPVSFGREVASVLLRVGAVVLTIILIVVSVIAISFGSFATISDGECTIAVMPIEGTIMPFGYGYQYPEFTTTPNDVRDFITLATDDISIEGILFEVNSPGGTPVASESIAKQISALELPNAVLIGDMGASGGYMVASAADRIFASPMSDVGSIGVTMSYVEESQKNEEDGLTYVQLITGKFKDAGDPNKPLSEEERTYFQGQLDSIRDVFVGMVAMNRNLPVDEVSAIADGGTLIGQAAVDKKLVDQIGDRESVKQYFAEKLGKDTADISFCEYVPPFELI